MAMVNIVKGDHRTRVSKDAYERMFKNKGYVIVGQETKKYSGFGYFEDAVPFADANEDTGEKIDIETIPVSDMSKEQLSEYAEKHHIDLKGVKNVREARQRVQKAMKADM